MKMIRTGKQRKGIEQVMMDAGWKESFAFVEVEIFEPTQNEANHFGRFFHFGKQTTALITEVELHNGVMMFPFWNLIFDKTLDIAGENWLGGNYENSVARND